MSPNRKQILRHKTIGSIKHGKNSPQKRRRNIEKKIVFNHHAQVYVFPIVCGCEANLELMQISLDPILKCNKD